MLACTLCLPMVFVSLKKSRPSLHRTSGTCAMCKLLWSGFTCHSAKFLALLCDFSQRYLAHLIVHGSYRPMWNQWFQIEVFCKPNGIETAVMSSNTSWRIDDMDGGLDGGLASELLNLSGLGNEYGADGAYNMRFVRKLCQLMILVFLELWKILLQCKNASSSWSIFCSCKLQLNFV